MTPPSSLSPTMRIGPIRIKPRRFGPWRVWIYTMPWSLNYKRPCFFRLRDGWTFNCLSVVLLVAR